MLLVLLCLCDSHHHCSLCDVPSHSLLHLLTATFFVDAQQFLDNMAALYVSIAVRHEAFLTESCHSAQAQLEASERTAFMPSVPHQSHPVMDISSQQGAAEHMVPAMSTQPSTRLLKLPNRLHLTSRCGQLLPILACSKSVLVYWLCVEVTSNAVVTLNAVATMAVGNFCTWRRCIEQRNICTAPMADMQMQYTTVPRFCTFRPATSNAAP